MDLSLKQAIENLLDYNVDISDDLEDIFNDEEINKELHERI
jgi:hypothetical protein